MRQSFEASRDLIATLLEPAIESLVFSEKWKDLFAALKIFIKRFTKDVKFQLSRFYIFKPLFGYNQTSRVKNTRFFCACNYKSRSFNSLIWQSLCFLYFRTFFFAQNCIIYCCKITRRCFPAVNKNR